ncbi:MAG: NAD-dependent epimerase/dehydratase family protein [Methylacidiphilales bacterium]|nr:NAD-dependent epimerase/dehydratase family protein [Candidatus Methylacidiphilales bacterium]
MAEDSPHLLPKKVLVTGAAGFIASRVCALLHDQGCLVTGLDNFNDAYDIRLKEWRWSRLEEREGLELHRLDLTDTAALRRLFEKHARAEHASPFDAVVNLAARAGVRASVENPLVYVKSNVEGALNLMEACRQFGVKKFVLASTSSLYGREHPTPYREDMNTDRQLSPYAATKKAAEAMAYTYHFLHGLDVSVLRYFTVYGPAGRPDMTPLRFVQRIREQRPITIFGDGSQSRDFTYVDDIALGTILALKPVGFETMNLGSDEPLKLMAIVGMIEELTGRKAEIVFKPWHPADMAATWADISKARRVLGWSPQTSIREGLTKLLEWYDKNRVWASEIDTN